MTFVTTETLPKGMALVETSDGRWHPALTIGETTQPWIHVLGEDALTSLIPPALDPLTNHHQGYTCRGEAIEACCCWHEAAVAPVHWETLAAYIEVYPERNVWYLDEIARLTGDYTPLFSYGIFVHGVVSVAWNGGSAIITATGATPDEAIEALYQRVYERSCQHQVVQRAS